MPFDFLSYGTLPNMSVASEGDAGVAGAGRSKRQRQPLPSVDHVLAAGDYFSRVPSKKPLPNSERQAA